ncbi:MAG: fused MFS/spermidine synthase [Polyangiaceae bacterium]|nr:fused MFS/spermidine synthase [Polyangiaceae bacterium]
MQARWQWIPLLLLGSGLSALVYQTAWQRMFRLVFGASTLASAAVLAIFLGGLGLGGYFLGKRSERSERPLSFYGNLELAVALGAALTPFLVQLGAALYHGLGGSVRMGLWGGTLVRMVLVTLATGPIVFLMGGTLPAAARAVESDDDMARRRLALAYGLNTLGAVAGAALGTFVGFEALGTRLMLWAACLLNLLVAMVARSLGRGAEPVAVDAAPEARSPARTTHDLTTWITLAIAALAGFAFLTLELVWYRILAPILGGTGYSFGLVLAVALAGIGLGSYAYARRDERRPATLGLLALTLGLEALAVGCPLLLGDSPAVWAALTRGAVALGFPSLVASWILVTFVIVFPAALVSGYQFPVIIGVLGRGRSDVARQVGLAYLYNTTASIAGSLLGGFVLLPTLGVELTWRVVVGILIVGAATVSGLAFVRERGKDGKRNPGDLGWNLAVAALASLCLLGPGPGKFWRHSPIGAGRLQLGAPTENELEARIRTTEWDVFWERDGVEAAVALSHNHGLVLLVNGKADGSLIGDRGTQVMGALMPALLHPDPKRVFVLGLGTGMSAGWVSLLDGVERVDVAELEPSILEVARLFAPANANVIERPNVRIWQGDGREWLLSTAEQYDVIASEPSNPYRAGIANVFTRELYTAARARLRPGGYFAQWVQGYEVGASTLRIVLKTMRSVFPNVEIWQTQTGDFLVMGTLEPLVVDMNQLRARLREPPIYAAATRAFLTEEAEGIVSHFVANHDLAAGIAEKPYVPVNTDDFSALEYEFARRVGAGSNDLVVPLLSLAASRQADRPKVRGTVDWARVEELRPRAAFIARDAMDFEIKDRAIRQRALVTQAGCLGNLRQAAQQLGSSEFRIHDAIERYVAALLLAEKGDAQALELATALERASFRAEAATVRARTALAQQRPDVALDEAERALAILRVESLPLCDTPQLLIQAVKTAAGDDEARLRRAIGILAQGPLAVWHSEGLRLTAWRQLATKLPDPDLCVAAFGERLTRPEWSEAYLAAQLDCLRRAGHPLADWTERELLRFVSRGPGDLAAGID